jgi:hypothetical protein
MRIDPSREEGLEPRVDAREAEPLFYQRVEAEPRQVAFVKDDRVAQRDGAAVIRLLGEHVEQHPRARAIALVPRDESRAVKGHISILSETPARGQT